ncbi:pantetheinase-like [Centruroides vittatus]|uniref:pantetheinase-like n=1 Tax=Centruroides vittatus TaxID=120091 RepID=UPI003510ADF5
MILLWFCVLTVEASNVDYYTASVFEYMPIYDEKQPIPITVYKNLFIYNEMTVLAAKNEADIVVFPEYGLYPFLTREIFGRIAQFVPDPTEEDWNPCTDPDRYENASIITDLSCMARKNNIFLVSNLITFVTCNSSLRVCPLDGVFLYNTNVVFDRKGKLAARYHKYHLYDEDGIDVPEKPEFVTFDTDFGKFGTVVCFDLLWKEVTELIERWKIDSMVYTSWWADEFPNLFSIETQYSWSLRFDINLIASNKHIPGTGAVGSGIYRGPFISPHYVYNPNGKAKLSVSRVPRPGVKNLSDDNSIVFEFGTDHPGNNLSSGVCSEKILGPPKSPYDYRCLEMNLSNFTLIRLKETAEKIEACNDGLCCTLRYKIANYSLDEDYYLIVLNGSIHVRKYVLATEVCGLVRCDTFKGKACSVFPTKSFTIFEELNLTANFTTKYVYPSLMESEIRLPNTSKWSFNNNSLFLTQPMDGALLTASLFGRAYNRDPI